MITHEEVLEALDYNPETGALIWIKAGKGVVVGRPALHNIDHEGYRKGKFKQKDYRQHRLIWFHQTGEWPDQVDHINGHRADNRWSNLRDVTPSGNSRNRRVHSTNKSGAHGVSWNTANKRWVASVREQGTGTRLHLGSFTDKADAIAARKQAEIDHGFHSNHGRKSS